jgi:hypothetical protein
MIWCTHIQICLIHNLTHVYARVVYLWPWSHGHNPYPVDTTVHPVNIACALADCVQNTPQPVSPVFERTCVCTYWHGAGAVPPPPSVVVSSVDGGACTPPAQSRGYTRVCFFSTRIYTTAHILLHVHVYSCEDVYARTCWWHFSVCGRARRRVYVWGYAFRECSRAVSSGSFVDIPFGVLKCLLIFWIFYNIVIV